MSISPCLDTRERRDSSSHNFGVARVTGHQRIWSAPLLPPYDRHDHKEFSRKRRHEYI
jgi:hypothetical protein